MVTGTGIMVLTQLVMIAVMTMTPVHMQAHGHGTQAAGWVIALHVGAMFLPSPLTGLLVDRVGRRWIAGASGPVLLAAGVVAAAAPDSVPALATALVLLGLGWNLGLVSGTALVTDALPPARRASAQGLVDVGIALAGATGECSRARSSCWAATRRWRWPAASSRWRSYPSSRGRPAAAAHRHRARRSPYGNGTGVNTLSRNGCSRLFCGGFRKLGVISRYPARNLDAAL
ncbi:MFS transporter [Streptomyces lydicus]|nr:MFS transporter [Streptomyces lydicus]